MCLKTQGYVWRSTPQKTQGYIASPEKHRAAVKTQDLGRSTAWWSARSHLVLRNTGQRFVFRNTGSRTKVRACWKRYFLAWRPNVRKENYGRKNAGIQERGTGQLAEGFWKDDANNPGRARNGRTKKNDAKGSRNEIKGIKK